MQSAIKKIERFYELFSGDDHILIPINADPDSIACAMAVKRLLWRKISSVTITNINHIKRPDNIKMIKALGIKIEHISDVDLKKITRIVYVDSQPAHHESFADLKPTIIIDHHPDTEAEAQFKDIRPEYGATASIITEYLKAAKIQPSEKLATALHYAIKTDTDNFSRKALYEDVKAFRYLYPFVNIYLVRKIEQAEMSMSFLKYFKKAIEIKTASKGWIFANLGTVASPDVCVQIADFFLRVNDIYWSVVSGIQGGKLIIILRSDGYRRNAGKAAQKAFGDLGSAGGHKSMARAEIQLSQIKDSVDVQDDKKLQRWIIRQIRKKGEK